MIVKYDFSPLFTCDSILSRDSIYHEHDQALGFFGDNFDRLKIHYDTITKDSVHSNKYHVIGMTLFDHNVVHFTGDITILDIQERKDSRYPGVRLGVIHGRFRFRENKEETGSGSYGGKFTSNWVINDSLGLIYDALDFGEPYFKNNQFSGYWKSYSTGRKFRACWGDYRIPNASHFDHGDVEFIPDTDHKHKGWKDYVRDHEQHDPKAHEKEHFHWWEDVQHVDHKK